MAALGTVVLLPADALLVTTGYTVGLGGANKGTVVLLSPVPYTLFPTGYSIAGSIQCPECADCPDVPVGVLWPPDGKIRTILRGAP